MGALTIINSPAEIHLRKQYHRINSLNKITDSLNKHERLETI